MVYDSVPCVSIAKDAGDILTSQPNLLLVIYYITDVTVVGVADDRTRLNHLQDMVLLLHRFGYMIL